MQNEAISTSLDPTMKYFGDVTANVQFDKIGVTVTDKAPLNAILTHPLTLANLLATVAGGIDIEAHDETALVPFKGTINKMEGVYSTVVEFVNEYGIAGTGTLDIDFQGEAPDDDVQKATVALLKDSMAQRYFPSLPDQLSYALAMSVAKNLIYEEFILSLAEQVGFATPESDDPRSAKGLVSVILR